MQIKILDSRLDPIHFQPSSPGASSLFDVRACLTEASVVIQPGGIVDIPLGFAVAVPFGTSGLLLPRSGFGRKGLVLANTVGLIDCDYTGQVIMAAYNRSSEPLYIETMERIGQFFLVSAPRPLLEFVGELVVTQRGEGGFGSTGTH